MYSLLIAEDELTTRRGLVNMVKWNEIGFQVDGEFVDGQELLEYLKNNVPDVILTDIKMSHVSGLDIARFVWEENLPIQIVFLSGYKDFAYAQSAVEYRVFHYLTKPVSILKLREVFTRIREKLDQQNTLQNAMINRVDHYQKLLHYQKQQFVIDAWTGNTEQAKKGLSLFDINSDSPQRLFLIRLSIKSDPQYLKFLTEYGLQELQEQLICIMRRINPHLDYYSIKWEEPAAEKSLSSIGIFWENGEEQGGKDAHVDICEVKEQLKKEIYKLMAIQTKIEMIREMDSPTGLLSMMENQGNIEESGTQPSAGIEHVVNYIQKHYCEDITLSNIAEKVFLNPIYISRLIKEQTGKNYTDLIMELRIQKAVELLKNTDFYVYEIAEKVGYHNLKYFYKVFKKVKGKSPYDHRPKKERKP